MSLFCHEHTANYKAQQWSGEVLYPPQRQGTMEISKYPYAWRDSATMPSPSWKSEIKYSLFCACTWPRMAENRFVEKGAGRLNSLRCVHGKLIFPPQTAGPVKKAGFKICVPLIKNTRYQCQINLNNAHSKSRNAKDNLTCFYRLCILVSVNREWLCNLPACQSLDYGAVSPYIHCARRVITQR